MRKSFLLVRSNLRKAKGQSAAIIVLILLAAFMLNLWLMLSMDYRQNFDRYHNKLNAEHVMLAIDDDSEKMRQFLTRTLEGDKRTEEFSMEPSMHMVGLFNYNGGEVNSELIILEKQAAVSRSIGRIEIVEDSNIQSGIYMPILYRSDEIAIGKTVELSIGSKKHAYTVCGFFNSIMAGSHNCGMCELVLTKDQYEKLEKTGDAPRSTLCSVRIRDKAGSESYETMLKNAVSSRYPHARSTSNSHALVSQSRYISQMVCSGVMSAMAFFILLIALVVIASNIIHYIQENMKNLGALKAIGYTSRQLICSLQLQFSGILLVTALAGAGISYILFPFVNTMMIAQTGIPYQVHFLPLPLLITLLITGGAVALVVRLSSCRVKRIEPVVALRHGIQTHNFKNNFIPLEKTRAPLHLALALKTTFSNIKHNVTVCISMLVLSLVVVFSGVMTENMIADMTPFLNLIVGETADSCINVNADVEIDFVEQMNADERVEKIYLYHSGEVRHVDGAALMATMCDDFSKANNQDVVFEGRFPRLDNEIAIAAKYAGEKDLNIGEEIAVTAEGKTADYIISGFTQTSNNLGKDCLLTRKGYERLGELKNAGYYLNLTGDTDIDRFNSEVKELFGREVNTTINIEAIVDGSATVYVSLMMVIVIGIFVLSAVVITFVLYLLVRTMMDNQKQDYGVLKALGYTSGQLIRQTALSFMPAVICSAIVGLTVCSLIINPLISLFLGGIGIVKCTFTVPTAFIIIAGVGLVLFTFAIVCLLSLKIKKIVPRALLTGQE